MLNDLLLLSGNDIPFPEAKITVHQPTLKEIAYIGEDAFFTGCGFLDFSKDLLNTEDKNRLEHFNDFDIFMSIVLKPTKETQKSIENAFLVLALIFPLYSLEVRIDAIVLKQNEQEFYINRNNFSNFKIILSEMFHLKTDTDGTGNYNPTDGNMAQYIANKFKKRHEKLLKLKNESSDAKSIAILSRYASILAVGLQKDMNLLMNYTIWQLFNEFQRFQLKMQWDAYMQARMAGAKDLEEVDNWMIDLREQGKNKNKDKNKK